MIRPARPGDHDAIWQIVTDAYAPWIARIGKQPGPMLDDYHRRIAAGQVWVIEVTGTIMGLLVIEDAGQDLLLDNVAVAAAGQGRGYGRALIAYAEHEARRRGRPMLRLYTNVLMTENIALYRRLGFIETGRIHEGGYDRMTMAKDLS